MYHGGSFEEEDPQGISTGGLGARFGTKKAAETRMWVQHIDQEIEDAPIWEEDGRYFLDEDMWPSQPSRGFKSEEAAKCHIATMMEYSEGPDDVYLTEAFLRIENPLELSDLGTWQFSAIIRELREMKVFSARDADRAYDAYNRSDAKGYHAIKALLMRKGFDGVKYRNAVEDAGKFSYIIFKPSQAKSVNNRGTWNRRDPSMVNPGRYRRKKSTKSNPKKPLPPEQTVDRMINLRGSIGNAKWFAHQHYLDAKHEKRLAAMKYWRRVVQAFQKRIRARSKGH